MVQNSGLDPKAMAVRFHCVMLIRENERARTKAIAAGIREGYPKTEAVMPTTGLMRGPLTDRSAAGGRQR